jgi:hypothetical protein
MQSFHRVLRHEMTAEEFAGAFGLRVERVAVYQGFVKSHIRVALEKNFTVLHDLASIHQWGELVERFYSEYPAERYELNACVEAFPRMLAELLADQTVTWLTAAHVQMAELEWLEWKVYASRVELPELASTERDTESPAETLAGRRPLQLNPTLEIAECSYPVATFIRAYRAWLHGGRVGEPPQVPAKPCPEIAFVFRHPRSLLHALVAADDGVLFAFKMFHDQLSIVDAAQSSGLATAQVENIVARAQDLGVLV